MMIVILGAVFVAAVFLGAGFIWGIVYATDGCRKTGSIFVCKGQDFHKAITS
jgi:hypothetical protein